MKVDDFRFNPKQIDITHLRELPEINLAQITAIPATVLGRGKFLSETDKAAYLERQRTLKRELSVY